MSAKPQTEPEPVNGQIFALIPRIMGEVGHISKARKNAQQGYNFRGVDDVYAAFQGPLAKHGVFYIPEVLDRDASERQTKSGGTMVYTTLTVAYTFYAPDGSCVRAVVVGEAMDSGDKSANKAMSAALKYALLQIFCVPCEANEDADAETHELAPARPRAVAGDAERRGKALAPAVKKRGDVYHVADGDVAYQVRQGDGAVLCTCDDYAAHRDADPKYRCAHKWAVMERAKIEQQVNLQAAREQA